MSANRTNVGIGEFLEEIQRRERERISAECDIEEREEAEASESEKADREAWRIMALPEVFDGEALERAFRSQAGKRLRRDHMQRTDDPCPAMDERGSDGRSIL